MHRPELVDGLVIIASGARLGVPEETLARAEDAFGEERDRLIAGSFADPATPMARRARQALDAAGSASLRGRLRGVLLGGPARPPRRRSASRC